MAQMLPQFSRNELVQRLQSLFRTLTETSYDSFFYKAVDGSIVQFEQVFPAVPTVLIENHPYSIGKKRGTKIDTFPRVVRFYPFETKGYEIDLGTKTHVCICDPTISSSVPLPENCLLLWISNDSVDSQQKQELIREKYGDEAFKRFLFFHNPEMVRLIRIILHCAPSASLFISLLLGVYSKSIYVYGYLHTQTFAKHYLEIELPFNIYFQRERQIFIFLGNRYFIHALELAPLVVPKKAKPKPKPKKVVVPKKKKIKVKSKPKPIAKVVKTVKKRALKPKAVKRPNGRYITLPMPGHRFRIYRVTPQRSTRKAVPRWLQNLRTPVRRRKKT